MSGKNRLFKSGKTIRLRLHFCRSRISVGFGKSAGFWPEPEPKSGIALIDTKNIRLTFPISINTSHSNYDKTQNKKQQTAG